jgi:hypothetical protein
MSTGKPGRLDSLARRFSAAAQPPEDAFDANVREMNRRWLLEKPAAIALAEFAQALAGTVMRSPALELIEAPPPSPAPVEQHGPTEPWRPDQHTETTCEKAWSVRWVEGHDHGAPCGALMVERPAEKPVRPKGWVDPYPGGDFLIPSYACGVDDEGEPKDRDNAV